MRNRGTFLNFILTEVPKFPNSNNFNDLEFIFRLFFGAVKLSDLRNDEFISLMRDLKLFFKLWIDKSYVANGSEVFFYKTLKAFGWAAIIDSYYNRIKSFSNLEFIQCLQEVHELGLSLLNNSKLYHRTVFKIKKVAESIKSVEEYCRFKEVVTLVKKDIKEADLNPILKSINSLQNEEQITPKAQDTKLPDLLPSILITLSELNGEYGEKVIASTTLPKESQLHLLMETLTSQTFTYLVKNSLIPASSAVGLVIQCVDSKTGAATKIKSTVIITSNGLISNVASIEDGRLDSAGIFHK